MAEQEGGSSADQNKNLKAEFDRKLGNVDQQMAEIKSATNQLLSFVQKLNKAPAAPAPKLEDVWLDKPDAAAAAVVDMAVHAIDQRLEAREAVTQKRATTIQRLVSEFPELSSNDHELTIKANEIYNSLSDEDKTSPIAYNAAVKEAALDLGYMPKSKRTDEYEEAFALRGGNTTTRNTKRSREPSIAAETLELAAMMGIDTENKEVVDRLKVRAKRDYKKWQAPK